jgi:hypothetical protein
MQDANSNSAAVVVDPNHSMIKSPSPMLLRDDNMTTKGTLDQATGRMDEDSIESFKQQKRHASQPYDHFRQGTFSHHVVDCVIIGSGASGLQCASSILEEAPGMSILILEARDRLGGRILTTHESRRSVDDSQPQLNPGLGDGGVNEEGATKHRSFFRDLGAAWVHGIGGGTGGSDEDEGAHVSASNNIIPRDHNNVNDTIPLTVNPMVELLHQSTYTRLNGHDKNLEMSKVLNSSVSSILSTLSPVLDPVAQGNPWTRPHTILHKTGSIALFLNGERIPNDSKLISRAIQRHYDALNGLSRHCINTSCSAEVGNVIPLTNDEKLTDEGGIRRLLDHEVRSTPHTHPRSTKRVRLLSFSSNDGYDEEEDNKLNLLTPFYMFLNENWDGVSSGRDSINSSPTSNQTTNDSFIESTTAKAAVAVSPALLSTSTDERYTCVGDFDGPHCKVKTGMITMLIPLIEKVCYQRDILHLGESVIAITAVDDERDGRVCIETATGTVVEAKCCVSTIPIGCLQGTAKSLFHPQLSNEKLDAIQSIRAGSYKKVFLTFDHIFWPKEEPFIGLVRAMKDHQSWDSAAEGELVPEHHNCPQFRLPGNYLFLSNLWAREGIPCIEAVLSGDQGVWAYRKDTAVIQNSVIEFLEASMGLSNLSKCCIDCHVTRWEEDDYTRGSYSSCQLDNKDRHVSALRQSEWDGRLLFAGEATEMAHMGSVHAALMSGKRAAREAVDFLASK